MSAVQTQEVTPIPGLTIVTDKTEKEPQQKTSRLIELSLCPRIWIIENFLSDEECDHLIDKAAGHLEESSVVDEITGNPVKNSNRTSRHTFLATGFDHNVKVIEARIASLLRLPIEYGEGLQLLKYEVGQQYKPHHDYSDVSKPGGLKMLERGGQRVATMLMYLNDVEAGGETFFPLINIAVKPKKGSALLFYNLHTNGIPDHNTLHGSAPVIEGEKWVATKWIHERVYPTMPSSLNS